MTMRVRPKEWLEPGFRDRFPIIGEYERVADALLAHAEASGMGYKDWITRNRKSFPIYLCAPGCRKETVKIGFTLASYQSSQPGSPVFEPGIHLECVSEVTPRLREVDARYSVMRNKEMSQRSGKWDTDMGVLCSGALTVEEKIGVCARFLDDVMEAAGLARDGGVEVDASVRARERVLSRFLATHPWLLGPTLRLDGVEVPLGGRRCDIRLVCRATGTVHLYEVKTEQNSIADDNQLLDYLVAQRKHDRAHGQTRAIVGHLFVFNIDPAKAMRRGARTNAERMVTRCQEAGFDTVLERWSWCWKRAVEPMGTVQMRTDPPQGALDAKSCMEEFLRDFAFHLDRTFRFDGIVATSGGSRAVRFVTKPGDRVHLLESLSENELLEKGSSLGEFLQRELSATTEGDMSIVGHLLLPERGLTAEVLERAERSTAASCKAGCVAEVSVWSLVCDERWAALP